MHRSIALGLGKHTHDLLKRPLLERVMGEVEELAGVGLWEGLISAGYFIRDRESPIKIVRCSSISEL
jgi:hypothetical protein